MAERKMPTVEDFPSNANGAPKEVPATEPPMKMRGKVSHKRSVFSDVKNEFISEDAPRVGSYILYDVLLPALKDLILDIAHGSIDMAMGGGGRGYGGYGRSRSSISFTPYNRYYYDDDRSSRRSYRDEPRRSSRRDRDPSGFTFEDKDDATDLLDFLCDYIDRYGQVEVARFYDKIGETIPGDFTSEDYGWRNLSQAKVMPAGRGRWYINFPRVRAL